MESRKGSIEREGIERKVTVEAKSRKNIQQTKFTLFIGSQIIYSFKICLHRSQDGRGVGRGEHFPPTNSSKEHLNVE